MANNYLDLLTDDNFELILDVATNSIEANIEKINRKIKTLKAKLNKLRIDYYYYNNLKYTNISYIYVNYCMDNYLYNNFQKKENVVFVNIYDENNSYNINIGKTFISKPMKNPTYLDILIEANKSIIITDDYEHIFLEGFSELSRYELERLIGIKPNRNTKYYELIMVSTLNMYINNVN